MKQKMMRNKIQRLKPILALRDFNNLKIFITLKRHSYLSGLIQKLSAFEKLGTYIKTSFLKNLPLIKNNLLLDHSAKVMKKNTSLNPISNIKNHSY